MPNRVASVAKVLLTSTGRRLPARAVSGLRVATGYIAVARWVEENGWSAATRVASRDHVFDAMMAEVGSDEIAYLEFGVYTGRSFRRWVSGINNPQAEFHGFDSFEGLPESFDSVYKAGHFDVKGNPPDIADPRVHWHVGWFEDTLPHFEVPPGKRLVLTLDADLYSATKLVLDTLADKIVAGTLIYFDELSRVDHEPAAFDDFRSRTGKQFEPLAFEKSLNTGAFICRG